MPDWLWQGLLSNWVYGLIMLLAGLLAAYAKTTGRKWLPTLYHGLLGAGLAGLILLNINFQHTLSEEIANRVTIQNIQDKVRMWLENSNFVTQKQTNNDAYFQYAVSKNGINVNVMRLKSHDHIVWVTANLIPPNKETEEALDSLSTEKSEEVRRELAIAAAQAGVYFDLTSLKACKLEQSLPITDALTEDEFIKAVLSVQRGVILLGGVINKFGLLKNFNSTFQIQLK
jgi:hypothetical protein